MGELVIGYMTELDSPTNPIRPKIAEIAERLGALITHDAGDEILDW
jgi:hypothetical protein